MSNPLASAEARQAAEKIVVEFTKMRRAYLGANANMMPEVEATNKLIGLIAESYADLVRETREQAEHDLEGLTNPHRSPAECLTWFDFCHCDVETLEHNIKRAEAAESLNRQLVAGLGTCEFAIRRFIHEDSEANFDELVKSADEAEILVAESRAEAAINSATPKQGEGK